MCQKKVVDFGWVADGSNWAALFFSDWIESIQAFSSALPIEAFNGSFHEEPIDKFSWFPR